MIWEVLYRVSKQVLFSYSSEFVGTYCTYYTAFLNGCRVDSCGQPQPLKMLTPTCFSALFSNFFDLHLMLLTDLPFEKGGTPPSLSSLMLAVKVVAFEVFSSIRWQFRFENICSISILHERNVKMTFIKLFFRFFNALRFSKLKILKVFSKSFQS